jgi:putative membrane protein
MRRIAGLSGLTVLALAWGVSAPLLPRHPFTAHMASHMAVVAVAAPLLALAVAGTRVDPVRYGPRVLFSPIPASMVELVAVWGWHAPALHTAARLSPLAYAGEQASFLLAGLVLWAAVLGGRPVEWRQRRLAGIGALLFTSIHMTLLGALFTLAPRAFYSHHDGASSHALFDLQLGGTVMLVVGGLSYLAGALGLLRTALESDVPWPLRRIER